MCIDTDLFGEIIVLKADVELWLNECTRFDSSTPLKRKQQYINNMPIARIIARAKLDGSFYVAEAQHFEKLEILELEKLQAFPTKYVETEKATIKCPDYYHECTNENCDIYKQIKKTAYSRAKYKQRKAERYGGKISFI